MTTTRRIAAALAAAITLTSLAPPANAAPPSTGPCAPAYDRLTEMEALTRLVADRSMRSLEQLRAGNTADIASARQNSSDWVWVVAEGRSAAAAITTPSSTSIRCTVAGRRTTVSVDRSVVAEVRRLKVARSALASWMRPYARDLSKRIASAPVPVMDQVRAAVPTHIVDYLTHRGVTWQIGNPKASGSYNSTTQQVLISPAAASSERAAHILRHETGHALDVHSGWVSASLALQLGLDPLMMMECLAEAVSLELGSARSHVYIGAFHPGKTWACIDQPVVRDAARRMIAGPTAPPPSWPVEQPDSNTYWQWWPLDGAGAGAWRMVSQG